MQLAPHFAAMFAGPLSVPAIWLPADSSSLVPGRGYFDESTELVDGDVLTSAPTLLTAAATWPNAAKRDEVRIAGRRFEIRSRRLEDDGAVARLVLTEIRET